MSPHLKFSLFLLACALVLALLEIQIEGPDAWASKLPVWRIKNKWTDWFMGAKPITGYHFYFLLLILVFIHLPFGLNLAAFSWHREARLISFYILFWVLEDFLCIALSPHFGFGKFSPKHVWWHSKWWGFLPREYWIFTPLGTLLYILSH
jgi:hypothetical protein